METRRSVVPVTIAAVAGVTGMVLVNQAGHGGDLLSPAEYLAPKGVILGCAIAVCVFVIARLLSTSLKARIWGSLTATIVAGAFGLLVLSWNLSWGVTPISLEGAWLWPLAIVPLVLSFISFRGWRRVRKANET